MFDTRLSDVQDLRRALGAHVRGLSPAEVALEDAEALWEAFDQIERQAAAAKMLLAERVDESRAWARAGDRSAVDHLARKGGTTAGVARSRLETARRLRRLPATEAALRRGELSQPQAETIADAAAVNPGAEGDLLKAARTTTLVELRERARRAKAAGDPDPDATHRRIHARRRLRRFTDGEGTWNVQACGTGDAGAVFNASLDPIIDELFRAAHREGRRESRDAYAFDALVEMARRARTGVVAAAATAEDGPEASDPASPVGTGMSVAPGDGQGQTPSPDGQTAVPQEPAPSTSVPTNRPGSGTVNPSFLALLRVDVEALRRGAAEGDEMCEIAGVGPVPARIARDLLGDAVLKLVVTRGVDVVNVTHLGRGPTVAQRIALLWTTPTCTNERCTNTLAIEHDHRTPWTDDRQTVLGNLDRLCRPCHRLKTHDGWALVPGAGRRAFVPPDDPRHPRHQRIRSCRPEAPLAERGVGAPSQALAAEGPSTGQRSLWSPDAEAGTTAPRVGRSREPAGVP